jgi:enoyl-CoA hydratase
MVAQTAATIDALCGGRLHLGLGTFEEVAELADLSVPGFFRKQSNGARTLTLRRRLATPVIAAINGAASGGGRALALASDIRTASPQAFFNVALVRIGLTGCDVGVSWLLPRVVGLGQAIALENRQQVLASRSDQHREAVVAFLAKRPAPSTTESLEWRTVRPRARRTS